MNFNEEDYEKARMDAIEDKMAEDMFCTNCGEVPKTYMPTWSGSENWYDGYCDTCDKEREFVFTPTHGGDL